MGEVVLVASGGGHLQQLKYLSSRLPFSGPRRWVTFDSPQSRSLLDGENVDFVPYMGPRDYSGLARNLWKSAGLQARRNAEAVVSTGSGLALVYLPYAALRGIPTHYIESASRVSGPSLTGRIFERMPRIQVHTQYQHLSNDRWTYRGSIFEGFRAVENGNGDVAAAKRVVVSLGTIRPYGFRRLVERVVELLGPDTEVVWQTGSTDTTGLPIEARPEIPHTELVAAIKQSDLLVAHAGTGIALTAFQSGVCPVLVPREAAHREHVDDHQKQIADLLTEKGLAVGTLDGDLTAEDLDLARSRRVEVEPLAAQLPLSCR